MKQAILFIFSMFFLASMPAQSLLDTARIAMTGMDAGTAVSTDDAEQLNDAIDKLFDDDLDMGWEGDEFNIVTVGLIFRGINVPGGATIDSAYVEIFAHEDEGDPAFITIFGEAADSALTYNNTDLITSRPSTQDSVRWEITEDWTIWTPHRSPDLKGIIQEIVSRSGWKAGNAINLIFTGEDQGASALDNARDFEAFENIADPDDGGDGLNHPERIPKLYIYYRSTTAIDPLAASRVFTCYPNPAAGGTLTVSLRETGSGPVQLQLLGLDGRVLRTWARQAQPELGLPLDGIAPGMYLIQLSGAAGSATQKLIVE